MRWTMVDKMNEMDYGRSNECDGLCWIKWMRWTMIDKMNEMDCSRWNGYDGLC